MSSALTISQGETRHPLDLDWFEKNVPCRAACPADTDVPGYLDAIRRGDLAEAYRINLRDNVFPAVLGRACTRPCEAACRHGWPGLGESVAICFAKRSAEHIADAPPVLLDPVFPASGKRVVVIGSGPAGLSAARELCLWGHAVTVLEQQEEPGGILVQGIPAFRLPRAVVRREIEQIRAQGVEIRCGVHVEDLPQADAVVVGTGTHQPKRACLPGEDLQGVEAGLPFLKRVNAGETPSPARRVLVIGGGFTAVDCARVARRLGAEEVHLLYRRSEREISITQHEMHQFAVEGIQAHFLCMPLGFSGTDGQLRAARFVRARLVEQPGGRARPEPIPGTEFEIEADRVLMGLGQEGDSPWSGPGVFRAGDLRTGPATIVDAVASGKACAREVDRWLMGQDRFERVMTVRDAQSTGRPSAWNERPRQPILEQAPDARGLLDEVEQGFNPEAAETEASRCYLCQFKFEIDNELCIYCDRCLKVKPVEHCIVKVSSLIHDARGAVNGYIRSSSARDYNQLYLDQNQCIRCGACVEVCPVDCITLQHTSVATRPVRKVPTP